jgi:hypothetical protein
MDSLKKVEKSGKQEKLVKKGNPIKKLIIEEEEQSQSNSEKNKKDKDKDSCNENLEDLYLTSGCKENLFSNNCDIFLLKKELVERNCLNKEGDKLSSNISYILK